MLNREETVSKVMNLGQIVFVLALCYFVNP